jgi:DNA-binding NtrC family response regulator
MDEGVILVVDDDKTLSKMMATILQMAGYQVLTASDGMEALTVSRSYQGQIGLLISDIVMPKMNGVELANAMSQERPFTKVLLISGHPEAEIPSTFRLLAKPFSNSVLCRRVREVLMSQG